MKVSAKTWTRWPDDLFSGAFELMRNLFLNFFNIFDRSFHPFIRSTSTNNNVIWVICSVIYLDRLSQAERVQRYIWPFSELCSGNYNGENWQNLARFIRLFWDLISKIKRVNKLCSQFFF